MSPSSAPPPAPPPGERGLRRGRGPWVTSSWFYLSYLILLLFPLVFDPNATWVRWGLTAAVVAVFLPVYVIAERGTERTRRRAAVFVVVLGCVAVFANSGASVLFVYAAGWAGRFRPRRDAQRALLGITALLGVLAIFSPVPLLYRVWAFVPAMIFVWVVGVATMEETEKDAESRRLRIDRARATHLATAAERERIARDLHDLIGHALTSVVVRAQLVQRLAGDDPERAAAEGAEIERAARDALTQVRSTVQGWRRATLDEELEAARDALVAAEIELVVHRDPAVRPAPTVEAALAFALREAVTNVVRHAGATRCTVTIGAADGEIALRVADDGRGGAAPEGNGLTGMRERITMLGGRVERAVRTGTTVTVSVPLEIAG